MKERMIIILIGVIAAVVIVRVFTVRGRLPENPVSETAETESADESADTAKTVSEDVSGDASSDLSRDEENEAEEADPDYIGTEQLYSFMDGECADELISQFTDYLTEKGMTGIQTVSFLYEEAFYSDASTVYLPFELSGGSIIGVLYDINAGDFTIGAGKPSTKYTTSSDIFEQNEGGF